jgi:hypothetical protein
LSLDVSGGSLKVELWTIGVRTGIVFAVINRLTRNRPPRHPIFFAHPLAEIDELAAFRTKGSKRIILPLDLFVAGRTFFH